MPSTPKTAEFYDRARRRFHSAKFASSDIRMKAELDLRMVHLDQWDSDVRSAREDPSNPRPVLSFNREQDMVQYVSNQVRQNRPSIHVNPVGDGASEDTARVYEGIFRHIDYVSQADVATDHSVECSTSCSFGYYRICTEFVSDKSFDQEPRVKRILDQMSVYVDGDCEEPDYSDADYMFVRKRMKWEDYKRQFPKASLQSFDEEDATAPGSYGDEWQSESHITIAEYWWVEKRERNLIQLSDGTIDFQDDIEKRGSLDPETGETISPRVLTQDEVLNERIVTERTIHFDLINGSETLKETKWLGRWIPIIPVLGREAVVDGKRVLESLVRFIHDAQKLLNIYKSGIAEACGSSLRAQLMGFKGQFRGWNGKDNRNKLILEVDPLDIAGKPAGLPEQIKNEPPIQALTEAAMMAADDMKAGANIFDSSTGAAKAEYSGVSVTKRVNQADLVNFHFLDNLTRARWHEGRIKLDLIPKIIDTPRAIRILGEDGSLSMEMIATALGDDDVQHELSPQGWREVPGYESLGPNGKKHHRLDVGLYDVTVTTGPSYANRFQQNFEMIASLVQGNPMFWQLYGDLFFDNWQDLPAHKEFAKRAKLGLLPAVQQQMAGEQGQIDPGQFQALQAQLGMVTDQLKQALIREKAQLLKLQNDMQMKLLDSTTKIIVADRTAKNAEDLAVFQGRLDSIDKMWEQLHESEFQGQQQQQQAQQSQQDQQQQNADRAQQDQQSQQQIEQQNADRAQADQHAQASNALAQQAQQQKQLNPGQPTQ